MIEINLLPGDGKKRRKSGGGGGSSAGSALKIDVKALLSGITDKITDKYLLGAIGAGAFAALLIAFMFIHQTAKASELEERETKAIKDSAQFSAVLTAKARAEATRDSLYQQIAVIKSIDDSRYLWSHLMYEVSNALPQYTWLTEITQTSAPKSVAAADTLKKVSAADTSSTMSPREKALQRDRAKKARS
ncbi:MAG TPA: hypothetical protein VM166_06835, partial [Gemmatimonadaceae bacterium]|nr:hypothetical protein [Gemmatimonadaceae bacterium]